MIAGIIGMLTDFNDDFAYVRVDGLVYQVMIPGSVSENLSRVRIGTEITFHTYSYIEGNVGIGNMIPRLVGFIDKADLNFFMLLITVQGISVKKALKALIVPASDFAFAIATEDIATLKRLPEIGAKTAQKIIMELRGKVDAFMLEASTNRQVPHRAEYELAEEYQQDALDVLLQLQYTRQESIEMIQRITTDKPGIETSEELIQEVFKRSVRHHT